VHGSARTAGLFSGKRLQRKPAEDFIEAFPLLIERLEHLIESPLRILHAPPFYSRVGTIRCEDLILEVTDSL